MTSTAVAPSQRSSPRPDAAGPVGVATAEPEGSGPELGAAVTPRRIHRSRLVSRRRSRRSSEASDALRTRIVDPDGEPRVLLDPEPAATPVIAVARHEAEAWAHGRVLQPLDMGICGHDSVLLSHEDGTWSWYLGLHHTIVDAASRALVFDATAAVYAGEPLPPIESYYPWAAEVAGAEVSARHRAGTLALALPPAGAESCTAVPAGVAARCVEPALRRAPRADAITDRGSSRR